MKKILSILLALVMIFTMTTIAFAAGDEAGDPVETPNVEENQGEEGGDDNGNTGSIEDIPLWQVKIGVKVGAIIIKIVAAFVKVGLTLGILDSDELLQKVKDMFGQGEETPETTPAETPATPDAA